MGHRYIVHHHIADAAVSQLVGQDGGGVLGVAVDGAIGDHNGGFLGLITAPVLVLVDEPADVLTPHGTVQGADHLNFDGGGLLQQGLDLGAVLADDIGEVTAHVIQPFGLEVDLVGKDVAVEGAEGAEGVGGEQGLGGDIIGHHGLGPVDHGRHDKGEGVLAGAEGIKLLDHQGMAVHIKGEEVPQHGHGLGVAHDGDAGIPADDFLHGGAVVGLHVVDHQIVQGTAVQHMLQVLKELAADGMVHRIHQNGLLVQHHIGVIGHAAGNGVNIFKQSQTAVTGAYPVEIFL